MKSPILHWGAVVVGLYLVFMTQSSDGNTPATDLMNSLQPSTGTSFSDIGLTGWAGFGILGFGVYQLIA
jgi:hypothetical protein